VEPSVLTQTMEDYLKAIFDVLELDDRATTSAIALRLDIAPASVTAMIKKLSRLKLITYEPYQGVQFTEQGERAALEIVRHHRLLELFLSETLGVPWERVHEEAEKLEHVISEDLEDRIALALKNPSVDPHGAPIPARDGSMRRVKARRLSGVEAGETVTVVEVNDRDPELLRYLGELSLYPGTILKVKSVDPFEGPLFIHLNQREITLGRRVADEIRVTAA
jgi:DtxR family Mn-dependent transcriptional regulator